MPGRYRIEYTVIASRLDRVITPPEATFPTAGFGATVDNIWVQDLCPDDDFNHGALPESPTVGYVVQKHSIRRISNSPAIADMRGCPPQTQLR